MIKIENLCFSYGKEKIFNDFSCEFNRGERVCIDGVSGKGKTTLLRLICGLEKQKSGKIKFESKPKIAVVFQEDILLPWYSAMQNVSIVSNEEKAKYWLNKLKLTQSFDKFPNQLSGGMQRRVALARALSFDADVLILDEAFKGLDEKLKLEVIQIIKSEFENKLIIFTSHEQSEKLMATRIIQL